MKRRIILHIGGHKTGSSAQQVWFAAHANVLREQANLLYPSHVTTAHGNCMRIVDAWVKPPEDWSITDGARMAAFIEMIESDPDRDLLVSAEVLSQAQVQDKIFRIRDDIEEAELEPTSVLFVRNQIDQQSSLYAQQAKMLNITVPFSEAIRTVVNMDRSDWWRIFNNYRDLRLNPIVGAYLRKNRMPVVESFFDLIGYRDRFDASVDFSVDTRNPSIGELGVIIGLHVKRSLDEAGVDLPHNGNVAFSKSLLSVCAEYRDERYIGPNNDDRAYLRERYAAGNREIARLLSEEEAELLLTETLPEGPASARSVADLSITDRGKLATMFEECRSRMLANEDLTIHLSTDVIRAIPRIS